MREKKKKKEKKRKKEWDIIAHFKNKNKNWGLA